MSCLILDHVLGNILFLFICFLFLKLLTDCWSILICFIYIFSFSTFSFLALWLFMASCSRLINLNECIWYRKIDSQWEFMIWCEELKPLLCDNLEGWAGVGGGREFQDGGDICIPMGDSCVCHKPAQYCKAIIPN